MTYQIGDKLPEVASPVIDRMRLAYMTVSMRDPNRVHLEDDYAGQAGLPSVIAHGTFAVSYLGLAITRAVGADALTRLAVELTGPVFPGDTLRVEATVTDVQASGETSLVSADLTATRADGMCVARGKASFRQERAS
jgi:acyl dehydratase